MWRDESESVERWDLSRDRRLMWRFSRSITITSMSGVGGSATLRALRELLDRRGYKFVSGGDTMRHFARQLDMSIEDFGQHVRLHPELGYDRKIDQMLRQSGLANRVVAESRLAHGLIPPAFHVLLTCEIMIRARRRQRTREYRHLTIDEVAQQLLTRDTDNRNRYNDLYSGHDWNERDYDFIQSTDDECRTPRDRAKEIIAEHERWKVRMIATGIRIVE